MMEAEEFSTPAPLSEKLGIFGTLDSAVYRLEVVVVVFAMAAMSVAVFMDVVYQFSSSLQQAIARGDNTAWAMIFGVLGFAGMMAFAATGTRPQDQPDAAKAESERSHLSSVPSNASMAYRLGISAAVVVGLFLAAFSMLHLDSSTIYRVLLACLLVPVAQIYLRKGQHKRLITLCVVAVPGIFLLGNLPSGYSWAQSYGLFLLLWVGFLGGSIAARERRHLRVDLARKLLPARWLPHFNALSYLVAATFTGIVFYLGVIYLFGPDSSYMRPIWEPATWLPDSLQQELRVFPLPDDASFVRRIMQVVFGPAEPGEIPDWLKVLAIPVSMLLILVRFLGHTVVFAKMAIRGESFSEHLGGH